MRPRRKWPTVLAATILTLATLVMFAYLYVQSQKPPFTSSAIRITPDAGTYTVEGVTVRTQQGTVGAPTELIVTSPVQKLHDKSRPFAELNAPNVEFDMSLAGGAQPLKPLDVEIPLTGAFLPPGANPEHALLYSPNKAGEWRLVPGYVENDVLHAQLSSLSPKHIAFASTAALIQTVLGDWHTQAQQDTGECKHELGDGESKVTLTGSGWEKNANSAVHPCLTLQGSELKLKVANNSAVMWSMATSGPAVSAASSSVEVEMVRLIAKNLPHDKNTKAFLAEDHDAWVDIKADSLPVTVQMRADAIPFLAQSIWIAVKFGVGVFSGKSWQGQIYPIVRNTILASD